MTRTIRNWAFVALMLVIAAASTPLEAGCLENVQAEVGFSFTDCGGHNCTEHQGTCGEVCADRGIDNWECNTLVNGNIEGECDCVDIQ